LSEPDEDAIANQAPESDQLDTDDIRADAQRRQQVASVLVGDTLRSRAALDVFRLDLCTLQYAALRITHDSGNFSGVRLPLRQRREAASTIEKAPGA